MNRTITMVLAVTLIFVSACNRDHVDPDILPGSWLGTLELGPQSLTVVFNISEDINDSLIVTMDSPQQGAFGIPAGPLSLEREVLIIPTETIAGEFKGKIINDTLIEGDWSQGGSSFDLTLIKSRDSLDFRKPQEPVEPFPYLVEEVKFYNDEFDINLSGTLTIPRGEGPFKTAILISGSGAQNRDEELMGHKPFLVIADYLTRKGIAVLRYDDRGVGESEGTYEEANSEDLATDVQSAYEFLRSYPKVDSTKIGLIGHSEGGLIAPIVASKDNDIAFIVSLAGPGINGMDLIIRQGYDISKAMGLSDRKVRKSQKINEEIYSVIRDEPDNNKASLMAEEILRDYLRNKLFFKKLIDIQVKAAMASLSPESIGWLGYFFRAEPSVFWGSVGCPVLALNGDKDLQVAADDNLPAIEKALIDGGNNNVEIIVFPGLNHLFQHTETGLPSEYGEINETFSEEVLELIGDWINEL